MRFELRFPIRLTLFLLTVSPLAFAQAASPVQLAVGTAVACVLRESLWTGGETAVKCWEIGSSPDNGRELPVPVLNHVTQLAAARAAVCALESGRVHCWGYMSGSQGTDFAKRVETVFGSYTEITQLSGGPLDFCIVDKTHGAACVHDAAYVTTPQESLFGGPTMHPPAPGLIRSGYALACTVGSDQKAYCWPTENNGCSSYQDLQSPQLRAPRELTVSPASYQGCRPCALDQTGVVCWGTPEHYTHFTAPSGLVAPHQLAQIDTRRHGGLAVEPCVIDQDQVKCRTESGAYVPNPDYAGFVRPVALAGNESAQCAANDDTLLCYFGDGPTESTTRVAHGMWFRPFELPQLAEALDHAARTTYSDKSPLFSEAAGRLKADASLALYFLHALQPLIDGADSEFFAHFVKPNWDRLRTAEDARQNVHALKDFAAVPAARQAGLALLRVGLPLLRKNAPGIPEWDAVLSALAEALATDGAAPQLAKLNAAYAPLRAAAFPARERALAAFVDGLLQGLAP